MKYNYAKLKKNERQYDGVNTDCPVEAIYVKSVNPLYQGNPLIEALPRARTFDELTKACTVSVPGYREDLSESEKIMIYPNIKNWRCILPHQYALETQWCMAQNIAYTSRKPRFYEKNGATEMMLETGGSSPYEPICLLDVSGTGKSTTIENLLNGYPQVIKHSFDDGLKITQITYLYVVCPPNANMSVLLSTIAKKLDRALGYSEPVYEKLVKKGKNIGEKASMITDLIQKFCIGSLILDEIQQIDTSKTHDSTLNYLLSIVNDSGVNLCVVGTEEAYKQIFKTRKIERRTGVNLTLETNYYTDKAFFKYMLSDLWNYQFFDERVKLTPELIDTIYHMTDGIVDDLVKLFLYMHKVYFDTPKDHRETVDKEFISYVYEKCFPMRDELIATSLTNKEKNLGKLDLLEKVDSLADGLSEEAKDIMEGKKYIDALTEKELETLRLKKERISEEVYNISKLTGMRLTRKSIEVSVDAAMQRKSIITASEDEAIKYIFEKMKEKPPKGKRATKAKSDNLKELLIDSVHKEEESA